MQALVPSANLRAAILSLVGTIGEPAIGYYLDGKNTTGKTLSQIAVGGATFNGPLPVAETSYTGTGKLKFALNPAYAGESFVVLSGRMAHEVLHEGTDRTGSQDEEVVANEIETMIWAQQVVTDFTYATKGTNLTTSANYRLLLMLNSGDRQFPRVGIKSAPLRKPELGAAPGFTAPRDSTPATKIQNFDDDVREEFIARNVADKSPLPTYPTGRAILKNITGVDYTSSTTFSDALIDDIDLRQGIIGDAFAMRAARVIQVSV